MHLHLSERNTMNENTSRRTLSTRQGFNKKPVSKTNRTPAKPNSPALTGHEILLKKLQQSKIPVTVVTINSDTHSDMRIADSDKYTVTLTSINDAEHQNIVIFKSAICEIHYSRESLNAVNA